MLRLSFLSLLPLAMGFINPFYWIHPTPSPEPIQSIQPIQPIQHITYYDDLSPRFGNLFRNHFGFNRQSQVTRAPQSIKQNNEELCRNFGGVLIGQECLEFFDIHKNYDDARAFCKGKNGDLYVPEEDEVFIFQKFFLYFPESFNVEYGESLGWVGARRTSPGGSILTIHGDDVTENALYNIRGNMKGECYEIVTDKLALRPEICHVKRPFTCEYQLQELVIEQDREPNRQPYKNSYFSFFDKFNYG